MSSRNTSNTPLRFTLVFATGASTSSARLRGSRSTRASWARWPEDAAKAAGLTAGERNPFRSIVIRAIEVLHVCDEGLAIIDRYRQPDRPAVEVEPRRGVGHGWTEAPRGMLWHRYEFAPRTARSSQHASCPRRRKTRPASSVTSSSSSSTTSACKTTSSARAEQVIRSYDPCISCATHFLDLTVERT